MDQLIKREEILSRLRQELPSLRREFGVEQIALFGSFAHGTPQIHSDVDLIVKLSRPLGFQFITLADRLEDILGRKVDLVTLDSLNYVEKNPRRARVKDQIKRTLIYA